LYNNGECNDEVDVQVLTIGRSVPTVLSGGAADVLSAISERQGSVCHGGVLLGTSPWSQFSLQLADDSVGTTAVCASSPERTAQGVFFVIMRVGGVPSYFSTSPRVGLGQIVYASLSVEWALAREFCSL
ncbi:hypothetical protein D917_05827, partial [Trichinella nativa]